MPNQWVRVVKHTRPKNVGRVVPVEENSPLPSYTILPGYHSLLTWGPWGRIGCRFALLRTNVELLGPDECAELDKKYGLKGTESDEP